MLWWILGAVTAVAVIGYVAYKYPAWFGAAVNAGAAAVNSVDNQVKAAVSNTSTSNTA
jgi:hypothetical protein